MPRGPDSGNGANPVALDRSLDRSRRPATEHETLLCRQLVGAVGGAAASGDSVEARAPRGPAPSLVEALAVAAAHRRAVGADLVATPLAHVAGHIVQTEGVRLEAADRGVDLEPVVESDFVLGPALEEAQGILVEQ